MSSLIIITLSDPPLTDRPGNTPGLLSIAVNEGWINTLLENNITGFIGRDYVRIYGIALHIIAVIFNNQLYTLLSFAFICVGKIKQVKNNEVCCDDIYC